MDRETTLFADAKTKDLDIRRIATHMGGEVRNVLLAHDLPDLVIGQLQQALATYKVLFFRAQTRLDDQGQHALGARLCQAGAVAPTSSSHTPLRAPPGFAEDLGAASWHDEPTYFEALPALTILRGANIPAYASDAVWASMALAYDRLPAHLKQLADGLWAIHSNDHRVPGGSGVAGSGAIPTLLREAEHPVVHVHPQTGERVLLLGCFVKRLLGLSHQESARIVDLLRARVMQPASTVRWQWQQGDVVIWDNRRAQLFAIAGYGRQTQLMRRVTLHGGAAMAIDGRRSRTRQPDPSP